ncbi:acyl-CoA dehydrogenase family protein [Streptomyces axinellae]|uniref:acyl-CoA dehydrogenase family protein n=1 Tax=Streptomyces axinellae TaxID=552788 RepID=UPI0031DBFC54
MPVAHRIGEEGKGRTYLSGALGMERIGVFLIGHIRRCLEEVVTLAPVPHPDGREQFDSPAVRQELAGAQVVLKPRRRDALLRRAFNGLVHRRCDRSVPGL